MKIIFQWHIQVRQYDNSQDIWTISPFNIFGFKTLWEMLQINELDFFVAILDSQFDSKGSIIHSK